MRGIYYLLFIFLLFSAVYSFRYFGLTYKSRHPSINEVSLQPDVHLGNVKYYLKADMKDHSIFHLEKAIAAIREIEMDMDDASIEEVENSIQELVDIHETLLDDTVSNKHLNTVFESTLTKLALAELKVSEKYLTNHQDRFYELALRYAQMHLKNAMQYASEEKRSADYSIYMEIDSLLKLPSNGHPELENKLKLALEHMDKMAIKK